MKKKSIFLLLIFLFSMIPFQATHAEEKVTRTLSSALDFLYLSESILLNEVQDIETRIPDAVLSPAIPGPVSDIKTDMINQMINAAKNKRNDQYHKCNESVNLFLEQGKNCEAERTKSFCENQYQQMTDKIASLRIVRGGDLRNPFTKAWHGIKRSGAKIWRGIGPIARKVLREVGPQALQIVATGGIGSEQALKQLFKHTVKKIGREHLKQIAYKSLQRLLKIQLEVATAAGIDICDPKNEDVEELANEQEDEEGYGEEEPEELGVYEIRDTFEEARGNMDWEGFLPGCVRHQAYGEGAFYDLTIDLDEGTFKGTAAGTGEFDSEEWNWHGFGVYSIDSITGTVMKADGGSRRYKLEGTGHVDLKYRLEAYCPDDSGNLSVFKNKEQDLSGTARVFGYFYVDYDTWTLTINFVFEDGPARFYGGCGECELFPADP